MKTIKLIVCIGFIICCISRLKAQNENEKQLCFLGEKLDNDSRTKVPDSILNSYHVYKLDTRMITDFLKSSGNSIILNIKLENDYNWYLTLQKKLQEVQVDSINIGKDEGIEKIASFKPVICKGYLSDNYTNSEVRLTFNEGFIYGFVRQGDSTYFIQPLRQFIKGSSIDEFIVYEKKQAPIPKGARCGIFDSKEENMPSPQLKQENQKSRERIQQQLLYYTAVDYSIFQEFDFSVQDVYNTFSGVINLVESNFDNEFNDPFTVDGPYPNSFYISTCPTCDPWTTSADAEILIDDFKDWGNNNTSCRDNGKLLQLWTARNLFGIDDNGVPIFGVIGIAYLGKKVCTNERYQVLEYFSSVPDNLRSLVTHETGHNFNCPHDYEIGSNCDGTLPAYIMAPVNTGSNTWSRGIYPDDCDKNSTSRINDYYPDVDCLSQIYPYPTKENNRYVDFSITDCYQSGSNWLKTSNIFISYLRVGLNSTIYIEPGVTPEKIIISEPCKLERSGNTGTVVIGQR